MGKTHPRRNSSAPELQGFDCVLGGCVDPGDCIGAFPAVGSTLGQCKGADKTFLFQKLFMLARIISEISVWVCEHIARSVRDRFQFFPVDFNFFPCGLIAQRSENCMGMGVPTKAEPIFRQGPDLLRLHGIEHKCPWIRGENFWESNPPDFRQNTVSFGWRHVFHPLQDPGNHNIPILRA